MNTRISWNGRWAVAAVLLALAVGCRPEKKITRYELDKDKSGLGEIQEGGQMGGEMRMPHSQPLPPGDGAKEPTDRMVVAYFPLKKAAWFFKVTGPIDQVKKHEPEWRAFLESLTFEDEGGKDPVWDLPDGWKVGPPRPMRYKTLLMGDDRPALEMAISSLAPGQDLLANVNRWRGQIGLPTVGEDATGLSTTESNGAKGSLFDEVGKKSGGMRPPFAGGMPGRVPMNHPPIGGGAGLPQAGGKTSPSSPSGGATGRSGVVYDLPEGWTEGKTSSMVPVRLSKAEGDASVQITVVRMPAAANTWGPNAKRWAGQVGLGGLSDEKLEALTSDITVDQAKGKVIRLVQEDSASEKSMIAAMVKVRGTAWFVKLMGDTPLVVKNEDDFDQFVKTLKLSDGS